MSEDGETSIVVIAMLGNPFSPYYASARRRRAANPLDFCAMNVALHGPRADRWALTERRGATRTTELLGIGPSSITRTWSGLSIRLDERVALGARRIAGTIDVHFEDTCGEPYDLDQSAAHRWWPVAPACSVVVRLDEPSLRFRGRGYVDANAGDEPLEEAFSSWNWSRVSRRGAANISYAVTRRDGSTKVLDLALGRGGLRTLTGCVGSPLPRTRWGLERELRSPIGLGCSRVRPLEDTPFYARSRVDIGAGSLALTGVHETLSLERFGSPFVRMLLPARMRSVSV